MILPGQKDSPETFNDGLLEICEVDERVITSSKIRGVRFGDRTIGIQRHWAAKTAGSEVNRLVAVPMGILKKCIVDTGDVVVIRAGAISGQYEINQVQYKRDTSPPTIYLSLKKLVHPYRRADGIN